MLLYAPLEQPKLIFLLLFSSPPLSCSQTDKITRPLVQNAPSPACSVKALYTDNSKIVWFVGSILAVETAVNAWLMTRAEGKLILEISQVLLRCYKDAI